MAEDDHSNKRWTPYVCPECRRLFRVPEEHVGSGVVCPGCRVLLRLPGPEDVIPPAVIPFGTLEEQAAEQERKRSVRRRRSGFDESFSEEAQSPPWVKRVLIAGAATVVGLIALGWALQKPSAKASEETRRVDTLASRQKTSAAEEPLFVELEQVAKNFMEAPDVESAGKYVRHAGITAARMDAYYVDGYEPPGFRAASWTDSLERQGEGVGLWVQDGEFRQRLLWMVREKGEWKADWESWVGWCSVPWEKIVSDRPPGEIEARVVLGESHYFNFAFTDDEKWLSLRIRKPGSHDMIYGYVEAASPLGGKFQALGSAEYEMLIKMHFPEDSQTTNQVIIDDLLSEGWFQLDESP